MCKKLLLVLILMPFVASATFLKIGKEKFSPSQKNGYSYYFTNYCASATYGVTKGFALEFQADTAIAGDISWGDDDLAISVSYGTTVTLEGDIHSNYGNTLEICGPGRLQIVNGRISGYASVKLTGAVVEITPSDSGYAAITTPGSVNVNLSVLSIAGYDKSISVAKGIQVTGSMISILAQESEHGDLSNAAILDGNRQDGTCGDISIIGSVVSLVEKHSGARGIVTKGRLSIKCSCLTLVSIGSCVRAKKAIMENVRMLAISQNHSAISTTSTADIEDSKVFFGDGEYVLCSATNNVGVYAGRVEVDGADIEICSPGSSGTYSWEFLMKDGSLNMVDKINYRLVKQKMLTETAVMAVVGAYFKEWTTAHTAMLGNMLTDLDGVIGNAPQGTANSAIESRRFYQLGGKIIQGNAAHGYLAKDSKLMSYYASRLTPAFIGDSFNGNFEYYSKYKDQYYDLAPTNALGQMLSRVDYSPYWVYLGEQGGPSVSHTVTFDLGSHGTRTGGGELTQTIEDGVAAEAPTVTAEDGWRFTGWSCDFSKVTSDLTVTAVYEAAQDAQSLRLNINTGWNWVSLNVAPADAAIGAVFAGVTFADEDVVKSAEGSATYYGSKWYGELTTIKPGVAYMVRMSAAGSQTLTITGSAASTSVEVQPGWNWIGSTATDEVVLDALVHSGGFTDEDVIKSAEGLATYYGGKWYGELKSLKPGVGYKAKFAKGGTLTFGNVAE